jgi:hypothetical protein
MLSIRAIGVNTRWRSAASSSSPQCGRSFIKMTKVGAQEKSRKTNNTPTRLAA